MKEAIRIRALVEGRTIVDIPIGNLFLVETYQRGASVVNAIKGVTVQIIEDDKPILERTYSELELYPFKHADD
ncbi:MAG TPA: hypothetical protein VEM38_12365 [Burkholderiales bacterium]|nr:hypothetical protein [Burkholderiales bacterium]